MNPPAAPAPSKPASSVHLTIVVTGRNDNYGGEFENRFFRSVAHNGGLLAAVGVNFEYLLAEWNPLPDRPLLSERFVSTFPWARAIVIDSSIHQAYGRNPAMPFFEMPAKNAALRRAHGEFVLLTNADILFDDVLISRIARGPLDARTLYRAHRIDVPPALDWPTLKDPAHQLPSSEGRLPPAYYLGSAGDFMLASRSLWHATTGLNEVIRWTTQAKDWQFCLNVAKRKIPIEFLGDVFHLDHGDGFRNTAAAQRHTPTAHFGSTWDFEFGLPMQNRPGWGLASCTAAPSANPRITTLQPTGKLFSATEDAEDRQWEEWLGFPSDQPDSASAALLHTLIAATEARCRVVVRPKTPRSAVAVASLATVAAQSGLGVFCEWDWPECNWMALQSLPQAPHTRAPSDWVLSEGTGGWSITTGNGSPFPLPYPRATVPQSPRFNPLLCRRILRSWCRCLSAGWRRLALFGAGGHTTELLSWGIQDRLEYKAILSSQGQSGNIHGIPIVDVRTFDFRDVDAVLLSSSSYEPDMLALLSDLGVGSPVLPLYTDWPPEL